MEEYNLYKSTLLTNIKNDLSVNYDIEDNSVLEVLLDDVITNACFLSNRENNLSNLKLLSTEIKECVKSLYLQRGTEDVKSSNESGRNQTFKNPLEELKNCIIRNGKRVIL